MLSVGTSISAARQVDTAETPTDVPPWRLPDLTAPDRRAARWRAQSCSSVQTAAQPTRDPPRR
jgi:hypothetical protein